MFQFKRTLSVGAIATSLTMITGGVWAAEKPTIQIAILLDSSNSMDGLIDQTRRQLWTVVNALTDVRKDGEIPDLEVALYHYGNDSLPPDEGFNRQLTDFTTELDGVSEALFTIRTNGGQEYSGWVIQDAINQLNWDSDPEDFRTIFIAGNEPFDQGSVNWAEAVNLAKNQDVLVNTIYCGNAESRERDLWAAGAELGDGANFNIDQNRAVVIQPSPYDAEIRRLNDELNQTYLPYGSLGEQGLERQLVQDANAGAAIVTRGISKSSAYYRNSSWDLVDAIAEAEVSLETLAETALPEELQGLSLAEQEAYIANTQAEREQIQAQIRDLTAQREAYLSSLPSDEDAKDTLDYVMIQALRSQLARKGFVLPR
ncbi:VWA domain-containing protein [Synechococcus sp. BDU 130192]|uniref:VWA domain-containing protein n=1 Tax=Synechococcus sp. BDU 130192 TaxID=2042059 RepID=UPI0020B1079B|nr:VWA domain-containing protein [Synechococcus sp. BDU 130192]